MTTTHPYSHQMRYQITTDDYYALHTRLSSTLPGDGDAGMIHTLLFASYRSRIPAQFMGQDGGAQQMEPNFSLHYFNGDPTYLLLERLLGQESDTAMVTEAECRALLDGETDWLLSRSNPIFQDFHEGLTERMLLPKMLLSYHRETYTMDDLDLWVALDTNIHTTLQHMDFLDPALLERDTADQEGRILMEISYSSEIPDRLLCLLEEIAPRRKLLA